MLTKPKIICHIMSSVDGRLLNERWTPPFDGRTPSDVMRVYAEVAASLGTDAWLFGRNTLQGMAFPQRFDHSDGPAAAGFTTYAAPRRSKRMFVVADPDGEILYTSGTVRGDDIATILGCRVSERYLEYLRAAGISYLFAGERGDDLPLAMHKLRAEFGVGSLSVQGGGIIDGAFLRAGLLDELSLLVYPGIDGLSGIPSVFEAAGSADERPAGGQTLELLSVECLAGGVARLHYKFHR